MRFPFVRYLQVIWDAADERLGISTVWNATARHPIPREKGFMAWTYVLGSMTLTSFIVLVVTGIALATVYIPSTGQAYDSLQYITNVAPMGSILRGLHVWSASAMVICIGLHMIQVFLIGAYKYPREVNWLTGAALLALTMGMAFTGQLLRWDNIAYWSIFILAQQAARFPVLGPWLVDFLLAGHTIGGTTLSRFYAFHVFFIPAAIFALIGVHLYLVIYHGISESPKLGRVVDPKTYKHWYHSLLEREGVPFWPDGVWRDVVASFVLVLIVLAVAMFYGPPHLDKPPDPTDLVAQPKPDWYFQWIFALLALSPHLFEDWLIIGGPLVTGLIIILVPFLSNRGERHFARRPWAVGTVVASFLLVFVLTFEGTRAPWVPSYDAQPLPRSVVASNNPLVVQGANLFKTKGCEACHTIDGYGGTRGPDLSYIGEDLTAGQIIWRIQNGGTNMPSYAGTLTPQEQDALTAFLLTRKRPPVEQAGREQKGTSRHRTRGSEAGR